MNFADNRRVAPRITFTDFVSNPDKDETVIVRTENFTGLLDHNQRLQNEGIHGSKEWRHVGNVPAIVIEHFCKVEGIGWAEFWSDQKWIKKLLNDPDFSLLRVAPGRV